MKKVIYRVSIGYIEEMIFVSETKQGYKAKYHENGIECQIWKNKAYSHNCSSTEIYSTEKCFFNFKDAKQYAEEQLRSMVVHHFNLYSEYELRLSKIKSRRK